MPTLAVSLRQATSILFGLLAKATRNPGTATVVIDLVVRLRIRTGSLGRPLSTTFLDDIATNRPFTATTPRTRGTTRCSTPTNGRLNDVTRKSYKNDILEHKTQTDQKQNSPPELSDPRGEDGAPGVRTCFGSIRADVDGASGGHNLRLRVAGALSLRAAFRLDRRTEETTKKTQTSKKT